MSRRWLLLAVPACLLLVAMVRQQPDPPAAERFQAALAAAQQGRMVEAQAAFAALAEAAGPAASPELLQNLALTSLRLQRNRDAEAAAQLLVGLEDRAECAAGHFLLGLSAFQRAERAAAAARLQDAEPMAWQSAQRSAEAALRAFLLAEEQADGLRGEWPAARRNAERAHRLLVALRDEAAQQAPPPPKQEPDAPEPTPEPEPDANPEEQLPEAQLQPLSAAETAQLLQRLQQREREKRLLRQAQQRNAVVAGERDW